MGGKNSKQQRRSSATVAVRPSTATVTSSRPPITSSTTSVTSSSPPIPSSTVSVMSSTAPITSSTAGVTYSTAAITSSTNATSSSTAAITPSIAIATSSGSPITSSTTTAVSSTASITSPTASIQPSNDNQQTLQKTTNRVSNVPKAVPASTPVSPVRRYDDIEETLRKQQVMEEKLARIDVTFTSAKYNEAIGDVRTLINHSQTDSLVYMAYNRLGEYLDRTGEHSAAVQVREDALEKLERSEGGVDRLNRTKLMDWINIGIAIAQTLHQQGEDGPRMSHTMHHVVFSGPHVTEEEEAEWKNEKLQKAVMYFKRALEKVPRNHEEENRKVRAELADALFDLKNFKDADKIYTELFFDDENPKWLCNSADCLWQQGKKDQAFAKTEQLISIKADFADVYKIRSAYFTDKNDAANAEESQRRHAFYSWVPSFCHHIKYNSENYAIFETLQSEKAIECVETTLANDTLESSIEFLVAIGYHHFHGKVEEKAFEVLEKRGIAAQGPARDFISSILIYLIRNPTERCVKKSVLSVLAGMKHKEVFDMLMIFLPHDTNLFGMDIPMSIVKLGDPRAIPHLAKLIEQPIKTLNYDMDAVSSFAGVDQLVIDSCFALSSFFTDDRAKIALLNGINKLHTHEACLVALYLSTGHELFLQQISRMLTQEKSLNSGIIGRLNFAPYKSERASTILELNQKFSVQNQSDSDTSDY